MILAIIHSQFNTGVGRIRTKGTPNKYDIRIGQNLKNLRIESGLSQADLGDRIGVSFQQIQKYEKGSNRIAGGTIVTLSEALNAPIHSFFEGVAKGNVKDKETLSKRHVQIINALKSMNSPDFEKSLYDLIKRQKTGPKKS